VPKNRCAWGVVVVLAVADLVAAAWLVRLWNEREAERAGQHTARQLALQAERAAIAAEARRQAEAAHRPVLLQADRQRLLPAAHVPVSPIAPIAPVPPGPSGTALAGATRP